MPDIVNCPQCERKLKVPDTLLGKPVKCPTCGATFTADAAGAASPPPLPPRPEEETYNEPAQEPARQRPVRSERARAEDRYEREEEDDRGYDEDYEERPRPRRRRRSRYRDDLAPHRGTLILVLGILAIVGVAPIILGPIAWIMGNNDLEEMRVGRMDPEGEGATNGGRICGMIATILWVAFTVFCCGCVMFSAVMDKSG
jgi:hypothetical protein